MTTDTIQFSEAEKSVLHQQNDKLTDDEFQAFLDAARRYRLNPLANQIYAQVRFNKDKRTGKQVKRVTYVTGIDGYRLIADRTSQYAGNDDPVFDNEQQPSQARVTVYKLVGGQRCPFTATARWDQYYPGDQLGFMWKRMPHLMLGKCAEALALRKAFPAELSGIYTAEEMHQADAPTSDREPFNPDKASSSKAAEPTLADDDGAKRIINKYMTEKEWDAEKKKTYFASWLGELGVESIADTTLKQRQRFVAWIKGEADTPVKPEEQAQEAEPAGTATDGN